MLPTAMSRPVLLSVTMLISRSRPDTSDAPQRRPMSSVTALAPLVTSGQAVDFRAVFVRGSVSAYAQAVAAEAPAPPASAAEALDVAAGATAVPASAGEAPAGAAAQAPAPTRQPGGFLAELELEARGRQTHSGPDPETIERNTRLANVACRVGAGLNLSSFSRSERACSS
jgi:hypothetical protein